jgi:hypothetical protein
VSQVLLSRGWSVSIIDTDTEMITVAGFMGMKIYFGDGARLDILHAAGAHEARAILICIDKPETATRIAEIVKAEYPLVPVLARAFDRAHALALIRAGVDFQIRETFESALTFGARALATWARRPRPWRRSSRRSASATPTASRADSPATSARGASFFCRTCRPSSARPRAPRPAPGAEDF